MSRENVEQYRRGIDAYNRGNLEAFLELLDPAVEFRARVAGVEGAVSGSAGVRSWWQTERESFSEPHIKIERVLARGDWVVAAGATTMRGAESGMLLEVAFGHASRWRDGKCYRFESLRTFQDALDAAGLSDPGSE